MYVHATIGMCRPEDSLGFVSLLPVCGSETQTQVLRLSIKYL